MKVGRKIRNPKSEIRIHVRTFSVATNLAGPIGPLGHWGIDSDFGFRISDFHRSTSTRHRAFTLIEVILAILLTVVIMGGVLAFYRYAMDLRQNIVSDLAVTEAHRSLMEHLTLELRSATVAPAWGMSMQGQIDNLTILTASLPAEWALASQLPNASPPPPADQDLKLVAYRLHSQRTDQGVLQIDGVERALQRVLAPEAAQEGQQLSTALIAPPIKFLYFRYYDGHAWQTSWHSPGLPVAVEINLGVDPLPEKTDPAQYPYTVFQRVVYLPGAGNNGGPGLGTQTANNTPGNGAAENDSGDPNPTNPLFPPPGGTPASGAATGGAPAARPGATGGLP